MKSIFLVGYMGSGKTTVGKKLALQLDLPFVDLDQIIEQKEGMSVAQIFSTKGEIYFRKKERDVLQNFLETTSSAFVLSWGGGTPCYANNHTFLVDNRFRSIYLKASLPVLINRLEQDKEKRPLLQNITNLKAYIGPHLLERSYYYNFAQYKISTDQKSVEEIVKEICSLA